MKDLTKRERIFMAIASLWLFMNVVMYFMGSVKGVNPRQQMEINQAKSILYPFGIYYHKIIDGQGYSAWYSIIDVYDFTELLVYGISPFVLFAIYRTFLKTKK
jgi:hypothetical protein